MRIPIHRCARRGAGCRATAFVVAHAIVDDDHAHLAQHFWTMTTCGYAARSIGARGKRRFMHHDVVGRVAGMVVSHENANKLDNRTANLKHCTYKENRSNPLDPQLRNKTRGQVRGVFYDGRVTTRNRWRGKVEVDGVQHRTRRCATEAEAADALDEIRRGLGLRVRNKEACS